MSNSEEMGGWVVKRFLNDWSKHPISLALIIIFITFAFVFLLYHNQIEDADGITIIWVSYLFSGLILGLILFILYTKKEVLYNPLEVLNLEITHRIHVLQEKLNEMIQVKFEDPYDEVLVQLCPKTDKNQINSNVKNEVHILESLTHILRDCGIKPQINALTYMALAKFYYKEGKYQKALDRLNNLNNALRTEKKKKADQSGNGYNIGTGELEIFWGLVLKKLGRNDESREHFSSAVTAGREDARCWVCTYDVYVNEDRIAKFINDAKECPNSPGNVNCINRLSTIYYKKALHFSSDDTEREANLRQAVTLAEEAIDKFDSWAAYFNKACDLSLMAYFKISCHKGEPFVKEAADQMKEVIFHCLSNAFAQRPALARFSIEEKDLRWIKNHYEEEFDRLIGRTYKSNCDIL